MTDNRGTPVQLSLKLPHISRFSLEYFIPHSGAMQAFSAMRDAIDTVIKSPAKSRMVYLFGAEGTGKTHLLKGFELEARGRGIAPERLLFCDNWLAEAESLAADTSAFVSSYQCIKTTGGVIVVASRYSPPALTKDPHVLSRALSGMVVELRYPRAEEMMPLLISLLERENLRLSEQSLETLFKLIPANPAACERIFSQLSEYLAQTGQSGTMRSIRTFLKVLRADQ